MYSEKSTGMYNYLLFCGQQQLGVLYDCVEFLAIVYRIKASIKIQLCVYLMVIGAIIAGM